MNTPHIWSAGVARRSMMGHERTHNPSPAATFLLKRGFGAKRVARVTAKLNRTRRRFFKGNPLPALVGGELLGHIPGLKNLFKKRSDEIARGLAPAIVLAANNGNLVAARALIERAALPMNVKEHQVWAQAAGQLSAKIVAAVKKYADKIPQADQTNPAAFAASLQTAVNLQDIVAEEAAAAGATKAERAAIAAQARADRQQLTTTLGGVAEAGLTALARRSVRRRPTRRRRRY